MLHRSFMQKSSTSVPRVIVLGVTGVIASGKSERCRHLVKLSELHAQQSIYSFAVHKIDADEVGHNVYATGNPCYYEIIKAFGREVLQDVEDVVKPGFASFCCCKPPIDRRKLGARVFHTPESKELEQLNSICWPHIHNSVEEEIEKVLNEAKINKKQVVLIILEAALLIESSLLSLCDDIWIMSCDESVAVTRMLKRNQLTEAQAVARIKAQNSLEEKLKFLATMKFKGEILTFDTTKDTLEEGLRHVTTAFEAYCCRKLRSLQR